MPSKKRLDVLVYEAGFADSREKAKAIIMSGIIYVDGQKSDKPGTSYNEDVKLEMRGEKPKYVSRGGLKLEKFQTADPAVHEKNKGTQDLYRNLY